MHLLKAGWHRAICGRSLAQYDMQTTDKPQDVSCKNCDERWARLNEFQVFAGHEIRTCEIDYWAGLDMTRRFGVCRRFDETRGRHNWHWYQFSDRQRALLIEALRQDNGAAFAMGLKGVEFGAEVKQQARQKFKTQARIIRRVLSGKQDVNALETVLKIQEEIGEVFR